MKAAAWITLFYGIIILIGGVIGHLKAGSAASLIMGTSFGVLLILSSFGIFRDHLFPAYSALLLTLILDAFFTYRWLFSLKFIPSGLLAVISLIVLFLLVSLMKTHLTRRRR